MFILVVFEPTLFRRCDVENALAQSLLDYYNL